MSRTSARHRYFFKLVLFLILALTFEALSWVAIAALAGSPLDFRSIRERHADMQHQVRALIDAEGRSLVQLDPELGWIYASNYRGKLYSSNSRGLRGKREYSTSPPPGVLRVAAFGDSFVHANEVADEESWSARLEKLEPRMEVLNFGVGGFGTDQALLYFERRAREFDPRLVVLGFSEVDYGRNLNRFRRFRTATGLPQSKPRFRISDRADGVLELLPNPFPDVDSLRELLGNPNAIFRASEHDWFFEPVEWHNPLYNYLASVRLLSTAGAWAWRSRLHPGRLYRSGKMNAESEGFRLLVRLVDRFARVAEADGRQFVFMIFPGNDSDIWGPGRPVYQPLLDELSGRHEVLDLRAALRQDRRVTPANLRKPGRHYGVEANLTVAHALHRLAIDRGWLLSQ